jgi:hypothetical protein
MATTRTMWGFRAGFAALVVMLLSGCAGTIKQDQRIQGDVSRIEGVSRVVVRMSPDATKQQADNAQFSRDELANYMRRRLESKQLLAPTAAHHIDVVVTDIRVRSALAAVLFGFMAGDDHVHGVVRVMDANDQPLRSFEVKTSYALGGIGGGQDGTRMNWMYDKFAEMALGELEKVVGTPKTAASTPGTAFTPTAAVVAKPAFVMPDVSALPTSSVPVDNVEAVPMQERFRENYRQWLTWKAPRAWVVADGGKVNWAAGTNPKDPTQPKDPVERALRLCHEQGKTGCTLYAMDNRVVYIKPENTSQR